MLETYQIMNSKNKYSFLSDNEKKQLLQALYVEKMKSFADIADEYGTYSNKVLRDAKKFGIPIRNKSEAQQNALQTGKTKHPTLGKQRSEEVKSKIGLGIAKTWESMSEDKKNNVRNKKREQWNNLSEDQKANILKSANDAVRATSKVGSKLEKYILNELLNAGWRVEFHKEQILLDTKLQIDLFLPSINTAIEIDGPSHFVPVWGDDSLQKNIKYDQKKEGLLIGKGYVLIRVRQDHDFSKTRAKLVAEKVLISISDISKKFPEPDNRILTIKDSI